MLTSEIKRFWERERREEMQKTKQIYCLFVFSACLSGITFLRLNFPPCFKHSSPLHSPHPPQLSQERTPLTLLSLSAPIQPTSPSPGEESRAAPSSWWRGREMTPLSSSFSLFLSHSLPTYIQMSVVQATKFTDRLIHL